MATAAATITHTAARKMTWLLVKRMVFIINQFYPTELEAETIRILTRVQWPHRPDSESYDKRDSPAVVKTVISLDSSDARSAYVFSPLCFETCFPALAISNPVTAPDWGTD